MKCVYFTRQQQRRYLSRSSLLFQYWLKTHCNRSENHGKGLGIFHVIYWLKSLYYSVDIERKCYVVAVGYFRLYMYIIMGIDFDCNNYKCFLYFMIFFGSFLIWLIMYQRVRHGMFAIDGLWLKKKEGRSVVGRTGIIYCYLEWIIVTIT